MATSQAFPTMAIEGQFTRKRILSKSLMFADVLVDDSSTIQVMFRAGEGPWTKETLTQLNWDVHVGDIVVVEGGKKIEENDRVLLVASSCAVKESWKSKHPDKRFEPATDESQGLASKQAYANMIQLRGFNACKYHFSNGSCVRGEACHFWHGPPGDYKLLQEEWIQKRAVQKRELALLVDDPLDPHAKEQKSHRARIFCEWLVEQYGVDRLQEGSGVIDVAGGKGDIAFELWLCRDIPTTLIDPRQVKTRRTHLKFMAQHGKPKWTHMMEELNNDLIATHNALFQSCSIVVGMHPDEATEAIVDAALAFSKPFAIVPCCVMSRLFPNRYWNDDKVATYEVFVEYLKAKHPGIRSAFLPFGGRNQVLYRM
ncbi:hypothetical protein, variant 1 [Aphanomyces invadans]|uniref:C3H1-type domain-containing protein n=2 Tax=Aphanomyces invadans TaxID=157072 RepID=A0A024TVS1_9STRA|nr:hypothetical protein, variant 1 [Aphanomyces invadans]ETV97726.1 hypothetical protein, variant 1 [Aphanomyces invadans]|eukprot:XP_008873287.1 hypothetical protein, variant 1 [Aphanomyces invadans]